MSAARISFIELDPDAIDLLPMRAVERLHQARAVVGAPSLVRRVSDLLADGCRAFASLQDASQAQRPVVVLCSAPIDASMAAGVREPSEWIPAVDRARAASSRNAQRSALGGVRVLVTRARAQAAATASALRERGAIPIAIPTIALHPPTDPAPLESAARRLGDYDVVALTSANGVDALVAAVREAGLDARAFASVRIAAIGPGTADALSRHGLRADLVASEHRGEGLAADILADFQRRPPRRGSSVRARVLLARAEVARDALPDALRAAGVDVDVIAAYRTLAAEADRASLLDALAAGEIDAVLFTASSTVSSFCEAIGNQRALVDGVCLASIGPITSQALADRGLRADLEASPYTLPALLDALAAFWATKNKR